MLVLNSTSFLISQRYTENVHIIGLEATFDVFKLKPGRKPINCLMNEQIRL